jgi:hypothetical protein
MIVNYQNRILAPGEIVDYSNELIHKIQPNILQVESMVGFKLLMRDLNTNIAGTQQARFRMIESNLGLLRETGCILRETHPTESPDGFWLITFPVPQSMLTRQLTQMTNVVDTLTNNFGSISQDIMEINVSGKCRQGELEWRMARVTIPENYKRFQMEPKSTPYKMGHVIRINDDFVLVRTMWDWTRYNGRDQNHFSDIMVLSQLIGAMFH